MEKEKTKHVSKKQNAPTKMTETLIRITYTNLRLSCSNDCSGKSGLWERIWDFEGFRYFDFRFSKRRVGIWEILGLEID